MTNHDREHPGRLVQARLRLLFKLAICCFAIVALKVTSLAVYPDRKEDLDNIANRQYHEGLDLFPYRGTIYDRRKFPLAISVRRPSLAVNPRLFKPSASQRRLLGQRLTISQEKINKISTKKNYFAWLARKVPHDIAQQVLSLRIGGLYQVSEPFRYYPLADKFAHLIGYVGLDNIGLLGMERSFEKQLRGQRQDLRLIKDARNQPLFFLPAQAQPQQAGQVLHLTVDRVIQEISMEELALGVDNAKAKYGFVLVADPHTGQLLAVANYPSFDPNRPRFIDIANSKNTAVVNAFEPGSIVKPLVVATALDRQLLAKDDLLHCEDGRLEVDGGVIHDDRPYTTLTVTEVLINSSNICIYKIATLLGRQGLHDLYNNFSLTSADNSLPLPGQAFGRIDPTKSWSMIRFANISFGQGFLSSGVELLTAFNSIANGGQLLRPYLIERREDGDGTIIEHRRPQIIRRVLQPETARDVRTILGQVVSHGTGRLARLANYRVAGKTSTAEIYDRQAKSYSKTRRIAGFIGFAPLADPHVTIYVSLFEPGNKPYYGGKWAAPVFAKIAARVLKYLNVRQQVTSR